MPRSFEREYFDNAYGGDYDRRNPARKLRYYLREIHRIKPFGRLLDMGCAYGLFLSQAKNYFEVLGVDISHEATERAKKNVPGVKVLQADIGHFRTDERFDVITCFDILEHVPDLDAAFEKLNGLLREDGILALTVPVYDTLAGKAVTLLDRDETHLWKESRHFWRKKLVSHGFTIVTDHGLWRYSLFGRFYLFWGGKRWNNFSPAILLIGAKT